MPSQKPPSAGRGRPKGSPNKATANAREAIARFVDGHTSELDALLLEIRATEGPKAAWQCIMDLIEYHVPKLARTELTAGDGKPLIPPEGITFVIRGDNV